MLASVERSGVVEATHDGSVAAVRSNGTLVASDGEVHRQYLARSAAKPFQVKVAQSYGAALAPEQIAIGTASHGGQPIHLAYVKEMLAEVDLDERALRCPPGWPYVPSAKVRLTSVGHRRPKPLFHNCSGKHAAMLRACVAMGWPIETYLSPSHPLQEANREEFERMTGESAGVDAIDGCGIPVFSVSTAGLAKAYARLGSDQDYAQIWQAMHRYGALTSDWGAVPAAISQWADVAAKGGAEGLIGISTRSDLGIAIKSRDGSMRPLGPVVLASLEQLRLIPILTRQYGADRLSEPVWGGGGKVGSVLAEVMLT
ncbi:MAG TPA: hypothetical protein ENH15_01250 [Actinobacteria bacterium]|nr:hypothetical protein [Actinomycetota bacterium]